MAEELTQQQRKMNSNKGFEWQRETTHVTTTVNEGLTQSHKGAPKKRHQHRAIRIVAEGYCCIKNQ